MHKIFESLLHFAIKENGNDRTVMLNIDNVIALHGQQVFLVVIDEHRFYHTVVVMVY